jgi:hypothetical protein
MDRQMKIDIKSKISLNYSYTNRYSDKKNDKLIWRGNWSLQENNTKEKTALDQTCSSKSKHVCIVTQKVT